MATTTSTRRLKRPSAKEQQTFDPNGAGQALVDEARTMVLERQWKSALTVLRSARRLRPTDPELDELIVVAAAHAKNTEELDAATHRLTSSNRGEVSTWNALAASSLAEHDYDQADRYARQALTIEPNSITAWNTLAASYAGLGWFEESQECLVKTDQLSDGEPSLSPLERWQVGRAVNRWASTRTYTVFLIPLLALVLGLLAVAFVLTAPLVVRELRVASLDEDIRELADEAWAGEHRMRLVRGVGVLVVVVAWLLLVGFTGG